MTPRPWYLNHIIATEIVLAIILVIVVALIAWRELT